MTRDRWGRECAGLVQSRRSLWTGTLVNVYRARPAGLDPAGGEWAAVCEDHGAICNFPTSRAARDHAPWVGWCDECQAILQRTRNAR